MECTCCGVFQLEECGTPIDIPRLRAGGAETEALPADVIGAEARRLPADVIERVLIMVVRHCEFKSARAASVELLRLGLVCKCWQEAASDQVWKALYLRTSPTAPVALREPPCDDHEWLLEHLSHDADCVTKADGPFGFSRTSCYDGAYTHEDRSVEDPLRTLAECRFLAATYGDMVVSPFRGSDVPIGARTFKQLFERRLVTAEHAARAYRRAEGRVSGDDYPLYTCTTLAVAPVSKCKYEELSFCFELYELATVPHKGD